MNDIIESYLASRFTFKVADNDQHGQIENEKCNHDAKVSPFVLSRPSKVLLKELRTRGIGTVLARRSIIGIIDITASARVEKVRHVFTTCLIGWWIECE